MELVLLIILILNLFVFLWGYFISFISLFVKRKSNKKTPKKYFSFTTIICAHNEESVIKEVLSSLKKEKYKLNNIYVILDNCSDNTKKICNKYKNINIIEKNTKSSCKGDALNYGVKYLKDNNLLNEIVLILDADASFDNNLIEKLNEKYNEGSTAVMPQSSVSNPYDSIITIWYTIYWKMVSLFSRKAHNKLNLSSNLCGCGMSFKSEYLIYTKTITEDVEYFINLTMNNIKIDYINEATYQEQPIKFKDMINQLTRWVNGVRQNNKLYLKKYIYSLLKKFNIKKFDALITTLTCSATGIFVLLIPVYFLIGIFYNKIILIYVFIIIISILFFSFITGLYITLKEKYNFKVMLKGILTYFIFVIILALVYDLSIFKPQNTWIKISRKGDK